MEEHENRNLVPTNVGAQQEYGIAKMAGDIRMPPEEPEGMQMRRMVAALFRYKWLVLVTGVIGTAAGVLASRFVTPTYESEATIWIEAGGQQQGAAANRGPIRPEELLREQGWVDLLRSFPVLDDVVRSLRLYVHPKVRADSAMFRSFDLGDRFAVGEFELRVNEAGSQWALTTADGQVVERGLPGDSVGRQLGFAWSPSAEQLTPGKVVPFVVEHPRETSRDLADRLRAVTERNDNFLEVSLPGSDPVLITEILNAVTERFVDLAAELKREKLTELVQILRTQLQEAANNLQQAETELEGFKVNTITLPSERAAPVAAGLQITQDPVFSNFFNMQIELDQLGRDRESIERVLAQIPDSGVPSGALEVIDAVRNNSELMQALSDLTEKRADLRALEASYTSEYPAVARLQTEIDRLERQTIPTMARGLVNDLEAREASIRDNLASASRELRQIPQRQVQEARLTRRVTIADNLYTNLQQRYSEARLAEASSIPDVRILSAAVVPQEPVSDRAPLLLLMGLSGGFGLGVVLSLFLDRFDKRVRYPEQVSTQMGLPILGAIPHLKGSRNGTDGKQALPVIEAVRGVRLNLIHAYGAAGPLVVTVTSPGGGDGKSFVSSNLALAFADAGHRTLLIDADTRRGALHRTLGRARKPGLVDVLLGDATRQRAIQETDYPQLHFLAGGTRRGGAPELLGSPAMSELVTALRSDYSVIIIDCPPLGAGVDAYALGTVAGNMMLVLRTGITDREHAEAMLDVIDRLPIRVLGAVLNDVRQGRAYGGYYHSYYMPGYELEDETSDEPKALLGNKAERG